MTDLAKAQSRDIRAIAAQKAEEIDFSDVSPVLDWSGAEMGKFYRPPKRPATLRLDADAIEWLKLEGPGYQIRANGLLRYGMLHFKRTESAKGRVPRRQKVGRKKRAAWWYMKGLHVAPGPSARHGSSRESPPSRSPALIPSETSPAKYSSITCP